MNEEETIKKAQRVLEEGKESDAVLEIARAYLRIIDHVEYEEERKAKLLTKYLNLKKQQEHQQ